MTTVKSSIQVMSEFRAKTGCYVTIRPFEKALEVVELDGETYLLLETYRYVETRYEFQMKACGFRLVTGERGMTGRSMSIWSVDDAEDAAKNAVFAFRADLARWLFGLAEKVEPFTPCVIRKTGHVKTDREVSDSIEFERECYRPGTRRTPLDSYWRVQTAESTDKMERYW